MGDLMLTLGVVGLFAVRIGLPMLVMIGIGVGIDRWQTRRHQRALSQLHPGGND